MLFCAAIDGSGAVGARNKAPSVAAYANDALVGVTSERVVENDQNAPTCVGNAVATSENTPTINIAVFHIKYVFLPQDTIRAARKDFLVGKISQNKDILSIFRLQKRLNKAISFILPLQPVPLIIAPKLYWSTSFSWGC